MPSLIEYERKKQLLAQLQEEVERIEKDPEFAQQRQFIEEIDQVLDKFGKNRQALVALVPAKERERLVNTPSAKPTEGGTGVGRGRAPRKPATLKTYQHPETRETVEARNLNHKTLREWIAEHGKDTVKSWVIRESEA